ncbi:MAG: hypothetical protein IT372_37150 [Polyangiaceae bacterium]|nr:hypothetical protein [Polyangiaceae bacterium]
MLQCSNISSIRPHRVAACLRVGLGLALAALASGCVVAPEPDDIDDGEVGEAESAEVLLPDYIVQNVVINCVGGTVTVNFRVVNVGPVAGPVASSARMDLLGWWHPPVGTPPLPGMGGFQAYVLNYANPAFTPGSAHTLRLAADFFNNVVESNEGNNMTGPIPFGCL